MSTLLKLAFVLFFAFGTGICCAQEDKTAAINALMEVYPTSEMTDDMIEEMAKQVRPSQQKAFITFIRKELDVTQIDQLTRVSMAKVFTIEELQAMREFYSSKHGASAMRKMGRYAAEFMPYFEAELKRIVELINRKRK